MRTDRIMQKSFVVNSMLVIVKIVTGILFKSTALIADGIHSLSDLFSDVFVIIGIKQSYRPPDEEHPLGHGKIEYILSLFLGVGILFAAYQLITRVIINFNDPIIIPNPLSIIVVVLVIMVKTVLARYLINQGEKHDSQVITASGKESFTDVISSLIVLVGISTAAFGNMIGIDWLLYGDRVAGLVIGLLIIRIAVVIIWDAIKSLLGKSAKTSMLEETKTIAKGVNGVIKVDHLDMIDFGHYYQVMIDIRVEGSITVKAGHDIAHNVIRKLKENQKIVHVIVHVNPEE